MFQACHSNSCRKTLLVFLWEPHKLRDEFQICKIIVSRIDTDPGYFSSDCDSYGCCHLLANSSFCHNINKRILATCKISIILQATISKASWSILTRINSATHQNDSQTKAIPSILIQFVGYLHQDIGIWIYIITRRNICNSICEFRKHLALFIVTSQTWSYNVDWQIGILLRLRYDTAGRIGL